MESWTKQMGYPYLRVVDDTWTESSVKIILEQGAQVLHIVGAAMSTFIL